MAGPVFAVTLTCSDQGCALEITEFVRSLEKLDLLVCDDCGCCLQAVGYAELEEARPVARVVLPLAA